jgi:hypothetical protein
VEGGVMAFSHFRLDDPAWTSLVKARSRRASSRSARACA